MALHDEKALLVVAFFSIISSYIYTVYNTAQKAFNV